MAISVERRRPRYRRATAQCPHDAACASGRRQAACAVVLCLVQRVVVVGAGSWGTAMAVHLVGNGHEVVLWSRTAEHAASLAAQRENVRHLPGVRLPASLVVSASAAVLCEADVVVVAVPSHGMRRLIEGLASEVPEGVPVLSLTKGLEGGTLLRMTEVLAEVLPRNPAAVLTGPNLVAEIVAGLPAATVVAAADEDLSLSLQALVSGRSFRAYTNLDVVGSELGGALKNVVALAVGMAHGLRLGVNAEAALITRGLAEMTRLGVALGGVPSTFAGLAGMGDLVATCTSSASRNRAFGEKLASGMAVADIEAATASVAEGVRTSAAAVALARRAGTELPIAEAVVDVVAGRITPSTAVQALMQRELRAE